MHTLTDCTNTTASSKWPSVISAVHIYMYMYTQIVLYTMTYSVNSYLTHEGTGYETTLYMYMCMCIMCFIFFHNKQKTIVITHSLTHSLTLTCTHPHTYTYTHWCQDSNHQMTIILNSHKCVTDTQTYSRLHTMLQHIVRAYKRTKLH